MTKSDIVDILADGTGLTRVETAAVVDGMIATIGYALRKGETIDLRGFGRFKTVLRKERKGRNPQSGEAVLIPARKMPVFRCSKALRNYINEPFEVNEQFELRK